jgi:hypothetical protein
LDFLAKLAALVPRLQVNLTRYHGVFARNSAHRALLTKAGRGKGRAQFFRAAARTPAERRSAMIWAQRLTRVFDIDVQTCADSGDARRLRRWLPKAFHSTPLVQPNFPPMPWARCPRQGIGWADGCARRASGGKQAVSAR